MNKLCEKCGETLAADAKFCENCGAQVTQFAQPQPQYQPQNHGASRNKYSQLGGWLLLLVIANIIAILSNIGKVGNEIQMCISALRFVNGKIIDTALQIDIFGQIIALAAITFQIMCIVQILQRKPLFLRFMQIGQIVMMVSYIFAFFIPTSMIGWEKYDADAISKTINIIIGTGIGFFVAPLYYCKSVRVRTYMGSDEYMNKAIFAYKQPPLI